MSSTLLRTQAQPVLNFVPNEQPEPGAQAALGRLRESLSKDSRSAGEPVSLVIQTPRGVGVETQYSKALKDTIAGFERVFGKEIILLRSGTDSVLPFDGVVLPERPNTIFLDADGHANVIALLGHEGRTRSK